MKPPALSDDQIILMLRAGGADRNRAWKYIFTAWRTDYSKPVRRKGGTQAEADEALNRIALDFENRVTAADKPPVQNLLGYLAQSILNNWRNVKKKRPDEAADLNKFAAEPDPEPDPENRLIAEELSANLDNNLDQLGSPCKEILSYWSQGYHMNEIAQLLAMENEEAARKKKYKCLQKLIRLFGGRSDSGE